VVTLFNAGLHIPVMPFNDVVGNAFKTSPLQMGATGVNVGITFGLTVIINVAIVAHWPAFGVNV
jgi:hypothetical protein